MYKVQENIFMIQLLYYPLLYLVENKKVILQYYNFDVSGTTH